MNNIPEKNRFQLGDELSADLDEFAWVRRRNRRRFRTFLTITSLLLLVLVCGGLFYYIQQKGGWDRLQFFSQKEEPSLLERVLPATGGQERPEYRFYLPRQGLSLELRKAIGHYQANELRQALAGFEAIVNGSAADKLKAIALIYLGVIAMERDRFELARHQFLRALRYNPRAVGALVNLAILEQRLNNYSAAREYALQARKLAPQDSYVLLLLGNVFFEGQQTEDAISTYKQAMQSLPEDALAYYNLGLAHLRKDELESAIQNFKRAIERSPSAALRVRAHAHLGQLYFQKGDLDLAADHLTKAVSQAPRKAKYLYNLGVVYLHRKEAGRAIDYFKRSLKASEGTPQVYRSLAQAFRQVKEPDLAMNALQKALYINPGDLPALFRLGAIQHELGYLEKAAGTFRKIANITPGGPNTQEALYKLAETYLDMERHNSAIDVMEKAIGLQPKNPRAYLLLGKVYERSGRRNLAIEAWKKALQPQSLGAALPLAREEERRLRLSLGEAYRSEGAFDLALRQYQQIRERNQEPPALTEDVQLSLEVAETYMAAKDHKHSIPFLDRAARSRSASPDERRKAYTKLAQAYAYSDQSPKGMTAALSNINKAVRLDPDNSETRLMQAWTLMQTQNAVNREKALEVLTALTNSENNSHLLVRAYNLMGLAYMKNGEYRRALNAFDRALQLDPSNKEAYRNRQAAANAYEKSL